MDLISVFILIVCIMAVVLFIWEYIMKKSYMVAPHGRILIYGAGKAGKLLAIRIIEKCKYKSWDFSHADLLGFIDDDTKKAGSVVIEDITNVAVSVLGAYTELESIIKNHNIQSLFIAIGYPTSNLPHLGDVIKSCKKNHIHCYMFNFQFSKLC